MNGITHQVALGEWDLDDFGMPSNPESYIFTYHPGDERYADFVGNWDQCLTYLTVPSDDYWLHHDVQEVPISEQDWYQVGPNDPF